MFRKSHSGAKYKIFTVTSLIFNNNDIPLRWLSTASPNVHFDYLYTNIDALQSVYCYVKFRHGRFTSFINTFYFYTGKNPTYAQVNISFSRDNTEYCVKAAFCCFESSWKIKNITMVDFNNKVLNN